MKYNIQNNCGDIMQYLKQVGDWVYVIEDIHDSDSGRVTHRFLRPATEEEIETKEQADEMAKNRVPVVCSNPSCDNLIFMTRDQKKKFFTTYPLRYGRVSLPYCSSRCRELHMETLKLENAMR